MEDKKEVLKNRTKQLALDIIKLLDSLEGNRAYNVVAGQAMRSGTSVGANYRAACRARSRADFISKLGIVEEEVDETLYWLELLMETHVGQRDRIRSLMREADEILCIIIKSIRTARKNSS